jgi:hypothetical protein
MPSSYTIANADFELGDTGWTKGGHWYIGTLATYPRISPYEGLYCAHIDSDDAGVGSETSEMYNDSYAPVSEGYTITATARVMGVGADGNQAAIYIEWLNGSFARISKSQGNASDPGSHGVWELSNVTASAPAGAVYARVGVWGNCVENGNIRVDSVTWDYTNTLAATLTSPTDGATYTEGDNIPLTVSITGTGPTVTNVSYYDGATLLGSNTTSPYSYNVSTLAVGTHVITAQVTAGSVITTAAATITVSATPPPPDTREFKASNSYTYLVGSNFSGLGAAMPLTARVTGVEVLIDYDMKALIRSLDKNISDPAGSNPDVLFDIVNACQVAVALMSSSGTDYTIDGAPATAPISISRADFTLVEEGTSDDKKWTSLSLSTPTQITVGSETELFGLSSIAASDFLDRSIGIRFYPVLGTKPSYADSGDACIRFLIDKIRMRVYFDAGSAEYYFASPGKTQVIKGEVVSATALDGNFKTGDAVGVIQLKPELIIIDGSSTCIADTWTIHAAYPPTDANQIGTVAAREANDGIGMAYNGLPSSSAILENRSRYQFITANFFAVKDLDSIYGVHGLPRAFAYNGDFFYKIYTQQDPTKDQPRHIAYHHGHLALGYDDGRIDISVIGKPYSFDGLLGASEWSIGDRVTGLLPLSGTILGVFGSKSIWGISGTTVDNFATQVIAPNIGAIEYTVIDMGLPAYANAYGIYTLSQTQQYGDYLGAPMSQDISPWLRPRLVRKYTSDKEVVVAWPVRSKNQYRLAFADGYIMSLTLNAGQQASPTFSFQKYTIYSEDNI